MKTNSDLHLNYADKNDSKKIQWVLNQDENLKRIIECVNALQGIEDPSDFVSQYYGIISILEQEVVNLKEELTKKDKLSQEKENELCKIIAVFCHMNGFNNAEEMKKGLDNYIDTIMKS